MERIQIMFKMLTSDKIYVLLNFWSLFLGTFMLKFVLSKSSFQFQFQFYFICHLFEERKLFNQEFSQKFFVMNLWVEDRKY